MDATTPPGSPHESAADPTSSAAPAPAATSARVLTMRPVWPLAARVLFPYAFVYLLLYSLPSAIGLFAVPFGTSWGPVLEWNRAVMVASGSVREFWQWVTPWVGAKVLRLPTPITIFENGSGDTTHNYVQVFCYLAIALALGSAWHLLWRRPSHPRLWHLLTIYLRFVLAVTMLGYGFAKVFPTQMPAPSAERLLQTYGSSSPMGLLWTFIGASTAYQVFAGASEVLGGFLLFWRHTVTLGALVLVGVLGNVVMLNFCYDVPVKLYSAHLLAMAIVLLLPDVRRLVAILVLNRPAAPRALGLPWRPRWLNPVLLGVKVLFVGSLCASSVYGHYRHWTTGAAGTPAALAGSYAVEEFSADGALVPPLLGDATRWRRVVISRWGMFGIVGMDDQPRYYRMELDEKDRTITLSTGRQPPAAGAAPDAPPAPPPITLRYDEPQPGTLILSGAYQGHDIVARAKRVDEASFLLVNRGFRWVNEYPFNR